MFPAIVRADRPRIPNGVASGDVTPSSALIWSRTDRPARMLVNWWTSHRGSMRRLRGPVCDPTTDFTGRLFLDDLPAGQTILYEVRYEELSTGKSTSEPVSGSFRTPANRPADVRFIWSGDVAGQGYGINPEWGGLRGFEAVRSLHPDFFIHSGDTIYADVPIPAEVKAGDGTIWKNIVTEAKSKPAETLDDFRGAYQYNLIDNHFRRFLSEIPQIWQWDDHEVMNNWSPGKDLSKDDRYEEKDIRVLAARARQAFREYAPIPPDDGDRIFRVVHRGPLVDVFVLDMRSYRGPNSYNRQEKEGLDTAYLGGVQMGWLKRALRESKAVWKVIAADMPIGLQVSDGKDSHGRPMFEAIANGDGPALGRELEIANLLSSIKRDGVKNTVWFTADVHYTTAIHYSPERAQFKDFNPFWEFVSGPLHAGTFGPSPLDDTFGPEVRYAKHPPAGKGNYPPSAGMQFFGDVTIDAKTKAMRVVLRDISGAALHSQLLEAM